MGAPVVLPSNTPERISPGLPPTGCRQRALARPAPVQLLLHVGFASFSPAGHPSTTAPRPAPWLSPKVVTRKGAAEGVHFSTFAPSFFRSSKKPG